MLELRIICPMKKPRGALAEWFDEYAQRMPKYGAALTIETVTSQSDNFPPAEAIEREGELLLKRSPRGTVRVALDERGKRFESVTLAAWLGSRRDAGAKRIDFLIGGAHGLSREVREAADLVLSVSDFTLAHRVVVLVLAEQIYRAFTILKGEPYHKD